MQFDDAEKKVGQLIVHVKWPQIDLVLSIHSLNIRTILRLLSSTDDLCYISQTFQYSRRTKKLVPNQANGMLDIHHSDI